MKLVIGLLLVSIIALSLVLQRQVTVRHVLEPKPAPTKIRTNPLRISRNPYIPNTPILEQIFSQDHQWIATLSGDKIVTLLATGDVIPARAVNTQTLKKGDFTWSVAKTADVLKRADITLINLETPLLENCQPTTVGMVFCGSPRHVEGLVFAGVDVANLANNHSGNYGDSGVVETINRLSSVGILTTGTPLGPAYLPVKGKKFAFLGYNDVGISPEGISAAEQTLITKEVSEASKNADIIVVSFHWGTEYTPQPTTRQRDLAHLSIDSGADLVIGNHPHWIQPVEIYKDKIITYAHGNFIFDQECSEKTKLGVVGRYTFYEDKIVDVEFLPVKIENFGQPYFLEGPEKEQILKGIKDESSLIGAVLGIQANDRARGLVYDGLILSNECPSGFKIHASPKTSGRAMCTHGPDPGTG